MKKLFSIRILKRFVLLTALWLSLSFAFNCFAHSPHDVIDSLELSPNYEEDKTIFIIISDHLRKSTDGGYSWKELSNGLDNKYLLSSIAISPSFKRDKTLYLSSIGDGVYCTRDGGNTWQKVNQGLDSHNIGLVAFASVADNKAVLAAGDQKGLYRTEGKNANWHKVIDQAKITSLTFYPEPENGFVLAGDSLGNLYHSTDTGVNWEIVFKGERWGSINSIAIGSEISNQPIIFVGTENRGVLKSIDKGATFMPVNKGLPDQANIQSLALTHDYKTNPIIFASTWQQAVFRSVDGGKNWEKYAKGLTKNSQADSDLYRSPHFRDIRISYSSKKDKTIFLGGFNGLFKAINADMDWEQMETLPLRLIKGFSVSSSKRHHSTIAIVTYGGGAYITQGQTYKWRIANKGLKRTRLTDIDFAPNYESVGTLYSAHKYCILTSDNYGHSWKRNLIVPESWRTELYSSLRSIFRKLRMSNPFNEIARDLILNASEKTKPYPSQIVISPNFYKDKIIFFGTRSNGIYKSFDGGITSTCIWEGINGKAVTSLAISPEFPSDKTLFASFRGKGIYRTNDGGDTWKASNNGLAFVSDWGNSPDVHAITRKDTGIVISPTFKTDKTLFAGCSEGLFKTTDGARHWEMVEGSADLENGYVIGMAISPNYQNDQTILVSLRGKGLFKSINGGATFNKIASEGVQVNYAIRWIEFSKFYSEDKMVYAASEEEVFQSEDRGNTWQIIKRPVRYDNHREVIRYKGRWKILRDENFSASRISISDTTNAKVRLNFVGSGISWIGMTADDLGIAKIYLDNKFLVDVDQYSENQNLMATLYTIQNLRHGPHTIVIEASGTKNRASGGKRIVIDAFDVYP